MHWTRISCRLSYRGIMDEGLVVVVLVDLRRSGQVQKRGPCEFLKREFGKRLVSTGI